MTSASDPVARRTGVAVMPASGSGPLMPVALRREGDDRLVVEWNDGHRSVYTWLHLRRLPRGAAEAARPLPHPQAGGAAAAEAGGHVPGRPLRLQDRLERRPR